MRKVIGIVILGLIKIFAFLFYRFEYKWLDSSTSEKSFDNSKIIAVFNHTSLYEPLYVGLIPWFNLCRIGWRLVAPGASKTLDRPIVGKFWKFMTPGMVSISRKRDETWTHFKNNIDPNSVIMIAPEGRMKRENGLDLQGNKMTIKPGILEVIDGVDEGKFIIAYSGGLHHVQVPGQKLPKLFKTLHMNLEAIDIKSYKKQFMEKDPDNWRRLMLNDLQERLETKPPKAD